MQKEKIINDFQLGSEEYSLLDHLARLVEAKAQQFNITAIRDYDGIWVKHIIDSLYLLHLESVQELFYGKVLYDGVTYRDGFVVEELNVSQSNVSQAIPEGKRKKVLDIGTGAGFPGLPLAIACPWIDFTLVDGTNKKVEVVKEFVAELGLKNVEVVWGRSEELKKKPEYIESFDLVLARAVKYLPDLLKLLIPFAKMQTGLIAVYKAISFEEEQATIPIIKDYNIVQIESMSYYLPTSDVLDKPTVIQKSENPDILQKADIFDKPDISEKPDTPEKPDTTQKEYTSEKSDCAKFHRKIIVYTKKPSVKARKDLY